MVAFMPLYVLGFMGMPRRLEHYVNMAWQPWLIVAVFGALIIGAGVLAQIIQFYISIRDRKKNIDRTGDPWDGRTLEWMSSSPPPVYNFAVIPKVDDRDEWWAMKESGTAYKQPDEYHDIIMPKNVIRGPVIGGFVLVFGFAMVWDIWWLAIAGILGVITTVIIGSAHDDEEYVIPAAEVKRIEDERFKALALVNEEKKE